MSFLVRGQGAELFKCIMKKTERHLTSTLMDVWWFWPNPAHGNMGFQQVIHGRTFFLVTKQLLDENLVCVTKNSSGDVLVVGSNYSCFPFFFFFFVFTSCCFPYVWHELWIEPREGSVERTAPLRAQLPQRRRKVIRDKSHGLWFDRRKAVLSC